MPEMPTPRILVVDDEPPIVELVCGYLLREGWTVDVAIDGPSAIEQARSNRPDVIVLDLMLPGIDGLEVCRQVRTFSDAYVLMLTARSEEIDRIVGLSVGADDYLVKPFAADQLDARIRAVLRRAESAEVSGPVTVGGIVVDARARTALLDGVPLDLSPKEFDLLYYLAERSGEVVGKRELLAKVWNQPYGGADKTVDVHLSWLRRKLGESAEAPRYLHRVRGVGVKLAPPP